MKPGSLLTLLTVLSTSLIACIYSLILLDYHFFLSIGPGGTPSTPAGYAKICLLRLIARSRSNVLIPPTISPSLHSRPYFLNSKILPLRSKPRPRTAGLAPHRQTTQKGTFDDVVRLTTGLKSLVKRNSATIQEGVSCFEKHSLGLFLTPSPADYAIHTDQGDKEQPIEAPVERRTTCGTPPEIAHMHGSEGSMHLTLHPQDAATVIECGWGERHPLAGRWLLEGFVMVYAPVSEEELRCVMEIVRAAAWWVGSAELEL